MSSTASPATNPAVRAEPGGHERDGPPTAISPRPGPAPYAAGPRRRPVPCCAAPSRSAGPVTRWRPSPGSSRSTPSPTAVRCSRGSSPGPLSTTRCAHGVDLHPLDPRASPTRHIISAPGAAVDAIPFPVLGMDFDNGSEFTGHGVVRWAGNPGHPLFRPLAPPREERPGHHRDPRSNHVVRRCASPPPPRTPTPSTGCRAACESQPGTRVNYPGPHPQAHRVGRRQGRWAQAPVRPAPHTPRPAAGHRRPGRRPEGRIDRLPQPAQPRRHHPPHHRAPGRPRPPGQGQDRPAPASPGPPASCPTSARASGSGEPPRPPPITRAVPREAPKKLRGHLDMRHPAPTSLRSALVAHRDSPPESTPSVSSEARRGVTRCSSLARAQAMIHARGRPGARRSSSGLAPTTR